MKKLLIAGMINLLLLNIVLAEDKWEYKIYQSKLSQSIYNLTEQLNILGIQGWELITVKENQTFYIFKRKIEDEDD
jgi:hypothetical protein